MALKPLNSVGGFSVGETPVDVIYANGDFSGNKANFTGNIAALGLLTDNLYYANGTPWDMQQPAGSNNQIQFNSDGSFGASANFTFDSTTNLLTVVGNISATNANVGSGNILLHANGLIATSGNLSANNALVNANTVTNALTVNTTITGNTANFSGNITALNANLGNLVTANYVNVSQQINGNTANFTGNVVAENFIGNISGNLTISAPNTAVIYSSNGAAVGSNNFTWDYATNLLTVTGNADITGNIEVGGILTDNYYYANGSPVDFQQAAGSNTQIQFNSNNDFGASANLTFNTATDTLGVTGLVDVTGNVDVSNTINGNVANFSGNLTAANANLGNLATANYVNVSQQLNGNVANFSGNLTAANGNLGNLATANYVNVSQQINGNVANFTGNLTSLNADLGNLATANYVNVSQQINGNVANFSGNLTASNANLGNLATANYVNVANTLTTLDANVTGTLTAANVNLTGNLVVSNLTVNLELAGNTANFSGNVIVPNLAVNLELAGNIANFTGNLTAANANLGNLATANYVNVSQQINGNVANFSGNLTASNANLGNLATANYVNVANDLTVTGNATAANFIGALANGNSNVKVYANSNVEITVNGTANVATFTNTEFLVVGEIKTTAGNMLSNGNVTANGFLNGANANVTGEALLGSVKTANIIAPTGNITISAAGTNENIILAPTGTGAVSASNKKIINLADPTNPTDAATKEYVDAMAGEGLDIHTPVRVESPSALNATYAQGGTTPTVDSISGGNVIDFGSAHGLSVNDGIVFTNSFNGLVGGEAYWVYSVPSSTSITVKDGYFGPEVTGLTNGTSLAQASRANPGVGATLTNAGANAALQIDGVTLSVNDRVLVYTQANGYENGVYTVTTVGNVSTAWVLTRATDFNKYIPDSSLGLSKGSYVFVTQGATGAGESYVMTQPIGEVIIGTDNLTFTQFSAAGSYTAGNGINITGTTISANVDGVTTDIVGGNIVVKTSANLTTPNVGDATFQSLTWNNNGNGNVTANNLSIGNIANITLDLTVGGNIQANGTISANANVSGLNLTTSGNVAASGNVVANNVTGNALLTVPTANVSNIVNAGNVAITNVLTGNTANFSGNVVVPNLSVNLELAGNTANFSGNVIVPNLSVNLALAGNTANFTGNISALNANLGNLATANFFTGTLVNGNSNIAIASANGNVNITSGGNTTLVVTNTGANVAGYLDVTGNLTAGNIAVNNIDANTVAANVTVGVGNTVIGWGTVTTSTITANQTIAQFSVTGVTGVEFLVKGIDSTGGKYSVATVTAVTDGATNTDYAIFATASIGGSTGTLVVNKTGSNIALQVTPSSSNSTVWTAQYRTI